MPENYTHSLILETLKPYATGSWIKRFMAVQNAGPEAWLMLVRDFNIQHQEVEYLVDDIVRALEPPQENQSLIRAEMEQLEAKGQLDISTPELEAEWQKKLNDESDQLQEWKKKDKEARDRQRKADLEFIRNKKNPDDMVIPIKNQDPRNMDLPAVEVDEGQPLEPDKPIVETGSPAKELSEAEKEQLAFVPKPPPDKEPEYKDPVIKSITSTDDNGVVKSYTAPEYIESIKGLSEEGIERLKKNGIATVKAFEEMGHEQAKSILGMPAYQSIKSKLKT